MNRNKRKHSIEQKISHELTCSITQEVFRIPVELPYCHHVFEFSAIQEHFSTNIKDCPNCHAKYHNLDVNDLAIQTTIYKFIESLYPDIHQESLTATRPQFPSNNMILPSYLQANEEKLEANTSQNLANKKIKFTDIARLLKNKQISYDKEQTKRKSHMKQWIKNKVLTSIYSKLNNSASNLENIHTVDIDENNTYIIGLWTEEDRKMFNELMNSYIVQTDPKIVLVIYYCFLDTERFIQIHIHYNKTDKPIRDIHKMLRNHHILHHPNHE